MEKSKNSVHVGQGMGRLPADDVEVAGRDGAGEGQALHVRPVWTGGVSSKTEMPNPWATSSRMKSASSTW